MDFIRELIAKQGPENHDHQALQLEIERIGMMLEHPSGKRHYLNLLKIIEPVLTVETMQGFAFRKPHGYSGDYEIIDRIYTEHKTDIESLKRWDEFFHVQHAPQAVRNRKLFFINILNYLSQDKKRVRVLNVGSGPGRDMLEFFETGRKSDLHIDCIEFDRHAIAYASGLCAAHLDRIVHQRQHLQV